MGRLLITGIAGFTGRHIVDRVGGALELFGLGQGEASELKHVAKQYVVDLCDLAGVKRVIGDVRPDLVIHLAGAAFVGRADVEAFYTTNLIGSRNLLEALGSMDHAPTAIVLASSANIYGNRRAGEIAEEAKADPANEYGVSKLAMEMVARIMADRLPIIVTRPFNYTGVGQSTDFLIPKIVDHLKRRSPTIRLGNLDVARDFSDVRDVARAYMDLILNPAAIGETVNICSGRAYPLREVIALAEGLAGHRLDIQQDPALVRANEIAALWGSREKLGGLTADHPFRPLADTLAWMLDA